MKIFDEFPNYKMNKLMIVVVVLILITGGFLIYNFTQPNASDIVSLDNSISAGDSAEFSEEENEEIITTPTESPQTYNIEINGFAFQTPELMINAGDTVVWTNMDSVSHTVTSDSGSELNSNYLSKGQSYSRTFMQAGTFSYHCTPHPYMKGKIIVN